MHGNIRDAATLRIHRAPEITAKMKSKLPFIALCAIIITLGIPLIWLGQMWGIAFTVVGLGFTYTLWKFSDGKPWPQGDAGSGAGGESIWYDGDGGGHGGGGD